MEGYFMSMYEEQDEVELVVERFGYKVGSRVVIMDLGDDGFWNNQGDYFKYVNVKPVKVEVAISIDGESHLVGTDTAEAIKNLIKED
jgi:hypothetical protein